MINIISCPPGPAPSWDRYVMGHPDATLCHLSTWREIFFETYGHMSHYIMARIGKAVAGVLPLVRIRGLSGKVSLISMPFLDCGGILAESGEIEKKLLVEAMAIARTEHAATVELRQTNPPGWAPEKGTDLNGAPPSCAAESRKVRMLLALPPDSDSLMASFRAKLRSQIKRPVKAGCEAFIGAAELIDEFYRVFAVNMRDLGSPVHSKLLFYKIFDKFLDEARIILVRKGGKAIAGSVVIGFRDTLSNPWASSLKEYRELSPNMLLYWTQLKYGCEEGFNYFDFGRSSPDGGTYRFKEQWGARPHPLNWCLLSTEGKGVKSYGPDKPGFAGAISCWKRLPVSVTRVIGPVIRKRIGL